VSPSADDPKVPWHKNGVWIPWAVLSMILVFLAQVALLFFWGGAISTQVQNVQTHQTSTDMFFKAEHAEIQSAIHDLGDKISEVKTAQAVDADHTKTQDERLGKIEAKLK
jgi:hypothetical protein